MKVAIMSLVLCCWSVLAMAANSNDCKSKVTQAGIARAKQVIDSDFNLVYVGTFMFNPNLYRVSLSDFGRDVRADVSVDNACNIVGISVDEDPIGG